jgi:2-polyprenyl-6-methoxyphenol hydroxylase-like FAD-dependent oxidoreductase
MTCDVVIAGAGPTGLMLAHELARWGVQALVIERSPQQRRDSMGMAINALVVELLTERDLMRELEEDGAGLPFAHFAHLWVDPSKLREPHPANFVLPQRRLEERLEERAAKLGVQILRGYDVIEADQDGSGVSVRVGSGSDERWIRADYLIGCDGRDSVVRDLAGIGFPGQDSPFHGVVGDIEVAESDALYEAFGAHEYPAGLFSVSPCEPDVLRVAVGRFGAEPADPRAPVTIDEFRDLVEQVSGLRLSTGEPRWLGRWFNSSRHATDYRAGRILLAGDAAHVHFPLSGHGLGTSIEDAVNLGWKLAGQVHGWAPAGLLDTYHAERHPVGRRACDLTQAQVSLLHPLEAVAPLRAVITELIAFDQVNEYFVRAAGGLDVVYPMTVGGSRVADPDPLIGHRLPHYRLLTANGHTDVAGLLHTGRAVLLDLSGSENPTNIDVSGSPDRLDVSGSPDRLDVSGWSDRLDLVRAETSADLDARMLLLRPDGRIAWVARTADPDFAALRTTITAWLGDPLPQTT